MVEFNSKFLSFYLEFRKVHRIMFSYTVKDVKTLNKTLAKKLKKDGYDCKSILNLIDKSSKISFYENRLIEDLLNDLSMINICYLVIVTEHLLDKDAPSIELLEYLINDTVVNVKAENNVFDLCNYLLRKKNFVYSILKDYEKESVELEDLDEDKMDVINDFIVMLSSGAYKSINKHRLFCRLMDRCSREQIEQLEIYFLALIITNYDPFDDENYVEDLDLSINYLINHFLTKIYSIKEVNASFNQFKEACKAIE